MTDRELIAEFILQSIKERDLVEITLDPLEYIKGHILDKDVFRVNFYDELSKAVERVNFGSEDKRYSAITVQILREKSDTKNDDPFFGGLTPSFILPPPAPRKILVKDIVKIRKIEDENDE